MLGRDLAPHASPTAIPGCARSRSASMKVPGGVPRAGAATRRSRSSTRSASASTGCCCPRRTRSSTRAASRPSCAASASRRTCTACPTTWARVRSRSRSGSARSSRSRVDHGYTHVFAGYGFMAEDAEFIEAIERAGVGFMGPSSRCRARAGAKDEAKKLARALGNAVIPGRRRRVGARAARASAKDRAALEKLAEEARARLRAATRHASLEENAEALLQAGYAKHVELVTIEDLQAEARAQSATRSGREYPTQPHPLQVHRRRRRQGPARGREARRRSRPRSWTCCAESKVRRARLEPELPGRAQHRDARATTRSS